MDQLRTIVVEFLRDIRAQKLRTTLTVFGIMWGTVAIVVLLAFGKGFKRQLSIDMHGIGESIVIMFPSRTTKPYQGFGIGRPIRLIEDDAWMLASQVRDIGRICPEFINFEDQLRVGKNILSSGVTGIYPVYAEMRNIIAEGGGRFIDELDVKERRRVVFLGDEVKRQLFGETDAVGKLVYVGAVPFMVIGVMQKKTQNSSYAQRDQDRSFIPATTFTSLFGVHYVRNIIFQPADPTRSDETIEQVREVLGKKYRFDATDKDAIFIWDTGMFDKFIFYFFLGFNIFMGLIGSFTLAVGGIGVANIMFIVVQERMREIGVRRAVGAKKRSILFQFMLETAMIMALGSAAGFAIALLVTGALQYLPIKEFVGTPEISPEVALATVLVLSVIGLSAAFFPARRAANLDVVECLRM